MKTFGITRRAEMTLSLKVRAINAVRANEIGTERARDICRRIAGKYKAVRFSAVRINGNGGAK